VKPFAPQEAEVGMLAVSPTLQSGGVGSQLIHAAIARGKLEFNATRAVVTVLNERQDIMGWYKRLGFVETGDTFPFPENSKEVLLVPMHFVVLKKELN
jgi:ribosomal protein S18 acetylase RimI-like enzyme